ncbi:putative NAD(P)H-dependent FMN-containing oxidoreductase YwqN [bacterium BMS3Bbin14]|nr:putative NAD(P)H-dependent FMN-containing oxidoreductase YwqN [bacterium BMS3Abin13]GBE51830.1 putative NAD(P)H-dependent FMN-containing oxidoreductase YwqN [bacterium BMS3Bbin14]HDK43711.1 flavodoxin family protein [Desulfobacteraceae bacterium]
MKVLFILGSPRSGGNTELLLKPVMQGVIDAGSGSELVRPAELDIHPCLACGGCTETGVCVVQDDMQQLYDKIDNADRIVVGSPIYFYGVTAQAKAFIDRCQALWSRKYLLGKRPAGNKTVRKGYFVGVAATMGERVFEGAIMTVRYGLDAMDFSYAGELLVRGVDKKGEIARFAEDLERAYRFGHDMVLDS